MQEIWQIINEKVLRNTGKGSSIGVTTEIWLV